MGGRRLPGAAAIGLLALVVLAAACGGTKASGRDNGTASPSSVATTATATNTPQPATPTPTPHPLAIRPATAAQAIQVLEQYLVREPGPCPDALVTRWQARCASADVDSDGGTDVIYLIPLHPGSSPVPHPATVVVRRSGHPELEAFPRGGEADASIIGLALFDLADRTGDGQPDLAYLVNVCGARGCAGRLEIQSWDGTAWRDVGPSDGGIDNIEGASVAGEGASTIYTLHGGKLTAPGAGPPRAGDFRYAFNGSRYALQATDWDQPEYLYHAIIEADRLLEEEGAFAAAIAAYRSAIDSPELKDWKADDPNRNPALPSGREQLVGYALFRIAIATAASGQDPALAIDAVIAQSAEVLFAYAAEAFRHGYRDVGTVRAGCLEVTRYLNSANGPQYVAELFDYGYANPRKAPGDICPL